MNKILNPFQFLSTGRAIGWGMAGTLLSIGLLVLASWPVRGDVSKIIMILSTNLLLWLPLSALLYLAALCFSPSRIRAIDIFSTNLFSLLPSILTLGVLSFATSYLNRLGFEPRSVGEVLQRAANNLIIILLSVSMVWSMVWGCFAYRESANMKGLRSVVIFVTCYVLVSVGDTLLTEYF